MHSLSIHRASTHRPAGHWPHEKAAGSLTLDFDARHRRRIRLTSDQREDILLDLTEAVAMAEGDGLQTDDGRWLRVHAAHELLVEVRHKDPGQLVRLAWHLGNRHLPAEIREDALRIRPDHVIEEMLHGFGAELAKLQSAFQPEGGAYGAHPHHNIHAEQHHVGHSHDEGGHHHHNEQQ